MVFIFNINHSSKGLRDLLRVASSVQINGKEQITGMGGKKNDDVRIVEVNENRGERGKGDH